jgi:hypothetical protein
MTFFIGRKEFTYVNSVDGRINTISKRGGREMEIGILYLWAMLMVTYVAMSIVLFVVYKTTGGKWPFFKYMKWYFNHF